MGCRDIQEDVDVGMRLQERSRACRRDRALDHGPDGVGLVWAVGQDEHAPSGEDGSQTHGDSTVRGVLAAKPSPVGFDRDRLEFEDACSGVGGAPRFIEAKVPVLSKAEDHHVEPPCLVDLAFVGQDASQGAGWVGLDGVELRGGYAPGVGDGATQEPGATARFRGRDADVLIQHEHLEVGQVEASPGDQIVKRNGGVPGGHHHAACVGRRQPSGQQPGRGGVACGRIWVNRDVHRDVGLALA